MLNANNNPTILVQSLESVLSRLSDGIKNLEKNVQNPGFFNKKETFKDIKTAIQQALSTVGEIKGELQKPTLQDANNNVNRILEEITQDINKEIKQPDTFSV